MAGNSTVQGLIWPNFKPIRDLIVAYVTCNNEEDPIKNKGARVVTTLFIVFFRRLRAANSEVNDGILPKFKSSKLLWLVLLTARMKKIR